MALSWILSVVSTRLRCCPPRNSSTSRLEVVTPHNSSIRNSSTSWLEVVTPHNSSTRNSSTRDSSNSRLEVVAPHADARRGCDDQETSSLPTVGTCSKTLKTEVADVYAKAKAATAAATRKAPVPQTGTLLSRAGSSTSASSRKGDTDSYSICNGSTNNSSTPWLKEGNLVDGIVIERIGDGGCIALIVVVQDIVAYLVIPYALGVAMPPPGRFLNSLKIVKLDPADDFMILSPSDCSISQFPAREAISGRTLMRLSKQRRTRILTRLGHIVQSSESFSDLLKSCVYIYERKPQAVNIMQKVPGLCRCVEILGRLEILDDVSLSSDIVLATSSTSEALLVTKPRSIIEWLESV
eukprot:TRINITY_DN22293_c0_g2_i1.p1 TRINITY_DN22293_c0_g2~~TRINITY_DN22293_c0_g2_i1.p1  ORF type:complete len:353 (+),score=53.12 TRINITY_DN22293_c0_g2_i1:73-1131(+)